LHPVLFGANLPGFGESQAALFKQFPHANVMVGLLRDGFHDHSTGGSVELRGDGSPLLDYPLTDYVLEGARRAMLAMAQIQFEAGAQVVYPGHEMGVGCSTWAQAKAHIEALPMKPLLTKIGCAHVMGGCGMADDEKRGVTRPDGVHWQLENLSIHDGSLFPTSIGANPQLSIYGTVNRLAQGLVKRLAGKNVVLA
jgi:choline dehydrogenase-like flavoprotein